MKFTSCVFIFAIFMNSCNVSKGSTKKITDYPEYKLIIDFSEKIKPETGLRLSAYGINRDLPKGHQRINEVDNFRASYVLAKTRTDVISLQQARNLLAFVAENLLKEINSNQEVIPKLEVYPFIIDLIKISIYFEDENRIELGQGVAAVYLRNGEIEYEGYKINEYTGHYPASGKHFTIHKETYAEALELVNRPRCAANVP